MEVLIIRLSALGDVAMTLPAVYSVARQYPAHRFHVLTTPFCAQLYVNAPENVVLHPVEKPVSTRKILRQLSLLHIDQVADLHNVLRSWVIDGYYRLHGKPVTMLQKRRADRKGILQRHEASQPFTQRYFDVFAKMGLPCDNHFSTLFPEPVASPIELAKGSDRWIGIAPFARYENKIYPLEQMRQVVSQVASQPHVHVFLFGSKGAEADTLRQWAEDSERITSVAGCYSLREELALMSQLDVMVSMDSANMHLASLVGTRVVSVWGSTTPACGFLGWQQRPEDAVCLHLDCQPCSIGGSPHCPKGTLECLKTLQPSTIIDRLT